MDTTTMFFLAIFFPFFGDNLPEYFSPMPAPTQEIKELVKDLGDPSYKKRAWADKKLRDMGWKSLKAVKEARNHKDLEVAVRAKNIYNEYFNIASNDKDHPFPSIWSMCNDIRFNKKNFCIKNDIEKSAQCSLCKLPEGPDVARYYYEKAARHLKMNIQLGDCDYRDHGIARLATQMYITDLLLMGKTQKEVNSTLNKMANNLHKYENFYTSTTLEPHSFDWNQTPPGPLVPNDEFVNPNSTYPG